jgi:hypothetical protein
MRKGSAMRNPIIRILVGVGIAAAVVLFVLEVSLRLFPEMRPSYAQDRIESLYKIDPDVEPFWVEDDEFGYLVKPFRNDEIVTIDFAYTRQTDQFGFSNAKWPDSADVVIMGDSLLNGIGVGLEQQFTAVVEKSIPGASVLNLSLSGASPEHLLRFYRKFAAQTQPRIVFAVLYVASDVDNAKHFDVWNKAGRQWGYNEFRANHYLEALASLNGDADSPVNKAEASERENDSTARKLARMMINATVLGRELLYLTEPMRKGIIHDVSWPDGTEVFLYSRFQNRLRIGIGDDYPSLLDIFFGPLDELRRVVEQDGATFVVALIPSKEEIFHHADDVGHLRLVNEVGEHLDKLGMEVLDLYPPIRQVSESTAPFYPHDIHYNEAGNEAIGAAIAEWIVNAELLQQSR